MQHVLGMAVAVAIVFCSGEAMAKEASTTLQVSGWHCAGCSAATEGAIKKVNGVKSARADLKRAVVEITYDDSQVTVGDLEKAVEKAGYQVVHP